jgi:hypothetical protein
LSRIRASSSSATWRRRFGARRVCDARVTAALPRNASLRFSTRAAIGWLRSRPDNLPACAAQLSLPLSETARYVVDVRDECATKSKHVRSAGAPLLRRPLCKGCVRRGCHAQQSQTQAPSPEGPQPKLAPFELVVHTETYLIVKSDASNTADATPCTAADRANSHSIRGNSCRDVRRFVPDCADVKPRRSTADFSAVSGRAFV